MNRPMDPKTQAARSGKGSRRIARAPRSLGLPLLLICMLAGCSGNPAGTTLKFWTFGREGEVVSQLLPEFERAHPGVHVTVQNMPLTAAHEKLLTAFAGDALPDMCQLGNTWIPEFAALHALEPLQPYVDKSRVVRPEDYFTGIWDTNLVDGELYGVSWYVDTRLLFYRKDMLAQAGFDRPPRNWEEWRRAMAAIKADQGKDKYAVFLPLNEFEPLLNLAIQQSDGLLRDDGTRGNFESPGFRRAFAFYVDMFRQQWAPKLSNTQLPNIWDEFARGYLAFYISGPWNIGEFKRREPRLARPLGHGAVAGRRRSRRWRGRRFELCHFPQFEKQTAGMGAGGIPVRGQAAGSVL